MEIKEISFKNNAIPWELNNLNFSELTLLVGASGVGKTQILNSLVKLINISNGYVYNGVEWDLYFTGDENENYRWTGQFENIKGIHQQVFEEKEINGHGFPHIPKLLKEELYLENERVFTRENCTVKYENKESPSISPSKSVLNLFTTEKKILPVKEAFRKIFFLDYQAEKRIKITNEMIKDIEKQSDKFFQDVNSMVSQKLKDAPGDIFPGSVKHFFIEGFMWKASHLILKFFLSQKYGKEVFEEVIANFKDIFPQVEGLRFQLLENKDIYELQIKERGTEWIPLHEISSGMFKTLMHLVEIKLMAAGSVILIDEFENSLGVNCIDAVAGDLLNPGRKLQYIITSHHPYIINNIDMKYWKVVMRKGSTVFTKNADELRLGKSKHDAFKQLLNLEEFNEGIT
ncbi:MAG: ATP-binding protein [Acidobacteria bacterium]|jgi:predicted ATPase|nr:ATP-binding protein [Acidobacteriota bacterium]